jgi:H+/Cl- antiporter ClcA
MKLKKLIKLVLLLVSCALVGILVAVTYFAFEYAVHHSISIIWTSWFNSNTTRLLVVPLCVILTLIFFGLQHFLDRSSENKESHGLGGSLQKPTLKRLAIVLTLGFFSLVAGASLGPEAVLVPASMIIGSYVGIKLYKKDETLVKALAASAIMALMAAFFNSFIVGVLAIFLVKKQAKTKITPILAAIAVVASGSAVLTLKVIDPNNNYFNFPPFSLRVALIDLALAVVLIAAGYVITFALKYAHMGFDYVRSKDKMNTWWLAALVASIVLSGLYLLGGPLVQFTGNESIAPMLSQAATLGIIGLVWVLTVKVVAISWSKAMGYRGGLVFPMIFVASTLVAISQLVIKDANFGAGLIAAMIGILAAERKAKILF